MRFCCVTWITFLFMGLASLLGTSRLSAQDDAAGAEAPEPRLGDHYGFESLEIYKLNDRSASLLSADLNGDGLQDVLVGDNSQSRLDLLQQLRDPSEAEVDPLRTDDVNALGSDWRFQHVKIPVDRQVSAMAVGDLNHDGRTDIVYFGVPDRLTVRYQSEDGKWTDQDAVRLPDVPPAAWSIAVGDLNGDQRDDIAVLGKSHTYLLYQSESEGLQTPQRLFNTSDKLSILQIADLDGDGRDDLCYRSDADKTRSLCARFQDRAGRLGPEYALELRTPRGMALYDLDRAAGAEVLSIDAVTGRVMVSRLSRPEDNAGEVAQRLVLYGFGGDQSSQERDLATGDLDGDGRNDVVLTDPTAAQLIVYRQQPDEGLDLGTGYPSFAEAVSVRVADLDGDEASEVIVLSSKEKTIGISRLDGGRLTFPEVLPLDYEDDSFEPLVLEVADLNGDDVLEIVYLAETREGRSSRYALHALTRDEQQQWTALPLGDESSVELEFRGTPSRLNRINANGDDRPDFLVFQSGDRQPVLLVTDEAGVPRPVTTQGGIQLGDVGPGAVFQPPGGRGVLVAQESFARTLILEDQRWRVVDQYNADESTARIDGVCAIDLDGEEGHEIVLIDTGVQKLRILSRDENLFRPWKEVEIGDFPYQSCRVADLNNDQRADLLLLGKGSFAVLYAGRSDARLTEVASYQTQEQNVFYSDLVAGDLNNDERPDIAVIDVRNQSIDLLAYSPEKGLLPALRFQVFEAKSFRGRGKTGTEPREAIIADVTNDALSDLLLLTHDRVLLYPQDDGK